MTKYKISRYWNRFVLFLALKLIDSVWDVTERNEDLIKNAKEPTSFLKDIVGTK